MTQEEKAKAYDEALERAKKVHNEQKAQPFDVMLKIFPELKDEDERIRKAIIEHIDCKNKELHIDSNDSITVADAIAWLEKQREQKPSTIDIDKMVDDYANNKERGNEEFGKPVPCMVRAYRQGLNDAIGKVVLKPAWSEEDEQHIRTIIRAIHGAGNITPIEGEFAEKWLKSLKERVQPKQEWSGGDEAHLHSLVTHLEQWIESNPDTTGADIQGENVAWLKSLRPQNRWISIDKEVYVREPILAQKKDKSDPFGGFVVCCDHTLTPNVYERYMILGNIVYQNTWKPSDEQMITLRQVISGCSYDIEPLVEIEEHLKKLREE